MAGIGDGGHVSAGGSSEYRITQAPLGDIFGPPSIFVIPDYTRAFSWPLAQVQTLLEDLKLAAQNGTEQFLGTLTFAHQITPGEPPEVVDGQQRMVVLFMVLSYIHNWAASTGLHELRTCIWRCLCHDQGTGVDGTPWVTYRLNFAHQVVGKFFKENMLNSFMPVVFVEAEGHHIVHGGSLGAVPMPNKLMWHLYQTASHIKRHLDTILHTPNGPLNAERIVVHILSKCFVVAVLCQGKERGPAIFAHLNSTGLPLSSNDCLKAKLLAKLPVDNHPAFLSKWREMEEILSVADIKKFLEYVKQLEEFMGTMPQLQDAYQYFSLKIASVDNSKSIVDSIFSHASVFIQRTKLKRLHELSEMSSMSNQQHMLQGLPHLSAPMANQQRNMLHGMMNLGNMPTTLARQQSFSGMPSPAMTPPMPVGAASVHGGSSAKAALDVAALSGSYGDAFSSATAPARLELLGNAELLNSLIAQQQQQQRQQQQQQQHHMYGLTGDGYGMEGSHHGTNHIGGSQHGPALSNMSQGTISAGSSQHGQHGAYNAMQALSMAAAAQAAAQAQAQQAVQQGHMQQMSGNPDNQSPPETTSIANGNGTLVNSPQVSGQQQHSGQAQHQHRASLSGQEVTQPLQGPGHSAQQNVLQPSPHMNGSGQTGHDDPFSWCPPNSQFEEDYFKNEVI